MTALLAVGSISLILIVLVDTFETMLLPRRVRRQFRFARFFYVYSWAPWAALARRIRSDSRRNTFLSLFGPLSILVLIASWAVALIVGFALLHWAIGTPLVARSAPAGWGPMRISAASRFSRWGMATSYLPAHLGRFLAVVETGIGFGFLAVGHQLPSGALPGLLSPRARDLAARRPRRIAAHGRNAAGPPGPVQRSRPS